MYFSPRLSARFTPTPVLEPRVVEEAVAGNAWKTDEAFACGPSLFSAKGSGLVKIPTGAACTLGIDDLNANSTSLASSPSWVRAGIGSALDTG